MSRSLVGDREATHGSSHLDNVHGLGDVVVDEAHGRILVAARGVSEGENSLACALVLLVRLDTKISWKTNYFLLT